MVHHRNWPPLSISSTDIWESDAGVCKEISDHLTPKIGADWGIPYGWFARTS